MSETKDKDILNSLETSEYKYGFVTDIDTENVAEVAKQIATEAFSEIMEEGSAAMEAIQNVVIEQPLPAETVTNTASLQSSTEMNSTVVTLDDLLLDITEAAETITEETIEKEAEAISSIFEAAGTILGDMTGEGGSMEGMDLGAIAGSVGNILDSLIAVSDAFAYILVVAILL